MLKSSALSHLRQVHAYVGLRDIPGLGTGSGRPDIEVSVQVVLGLLAAEVCEVLLLLLRVGVLDVVERHQVRNHLLI